MRYFDADAYVTQLLEQNPPRLSYANRDAGLPFDAWQDDLRHQLRELTGIDRIVSRSAPTSDAPCTFISSDRGDGFTIEKRYLEIEAENAIAFYLLLPDGADRARPLPLVLCPHGHGRRGKEVYAGNYSSDEERAHSEGGERDIALQAVAAGYAVIAPDVRGFWEMARKADIEAGAGSSCEELQRRALMFGRTLIGERVHDMGQLIDYAQTRPEIDTERIMITGNSGGGTVSLFTAALDPRITVAVPGSYFCTFEASILGVHHCMCNVVPGISTVAEMHDVAGLIAPRPVLFVNGKADPIFPIDATRRAFAELRKVYTDAGARDACELFVGDGGHRYYKERVWSFAEKWL